MDDNKNTNFIFAYNLRRICRENSTNVTQLCKDLGISTSKVTAINKGSIPKPEMLVDMAKKLNCSVVEFFAEPDDVIITDEDEKEIIQVFRGLDRRTKHEFMTQLYKLEAVHND